MDKERFGKSIHKILYAYENDGYDNYISCLRNRIRYISGMEQDWVDPNWLVMLKGLKNLADEADHDDIRAVVLEIMGDLRRDDK